MPERTEHQIVLYLLVEHGTVGDAGAKRIVYAIEAAIKGIAIAVAAGFEGVEVGDCWENQGAAAGEKPMALGEDAE